MQSGRWPSGRETLYDLVPNEKSLWQNQMHGDGDERKISPKKIVGKFTQMFWRDIELEYMCTVYTVYIYTYMIIHHVLCVFVFDCDVLHRGDVSGFCFHNGHTSAVWTVRYRDHIFKIEAQKPKAAEVQRLANIGVPWKKIHQLLDMEKIMYNQLRFFKVGFHIN